MGRNPNDRGVSIIRATQTEGRVDNTSPTPTNTDLEEVEMTSSAEIQEELTIPTMGIPAALYKILKIFNPNVRPPRLSKREVAYLEHVAEEERRRQIRQSSNEELRRLTDLTPSEAIAFIGVKGAAATTTTMVHAASVFGDITRSMLVASDFNPASGTGAVRLGKDYTETITLRDLRSELATYGSFREFIRRIRPTRYSVRVISANDIIAGNEHLTGEDADEMMGVIGDNSEYHFVDTANDITDDVTQAVVKGADVLVFTANVAVHESLRQLARGMETLRRHGFKDKVDNAVVVISNIPTGVSLDSYKKYLNLVNIRDEVVTEYDFRGQFLGISHDPVIKLDREVCLDDLSWEVYQQYLELGIAIVEQHPNNQAVIRPLQAHDEEVSSHERSH